MQFLVQGTIGVSTSEYTLLAFIGEGITHRYQIVDGLSVSIAEELSGTVSFENGELVVTKQTVILLSTSSRFNRVEIIPVTETEFNLFFLIAQTDPDVVAVLEKYQAFIANFVQQFSEDAEKVLNLISEDSHTAQAVKTLEKVQWKKAISEVLTAIKTALPNKWVSVLRYFPKAKDLV